MFLQYLLSKFDDLEDISRPITYGADILDKTREFSSLEDLCYLFDNMERAKVDRQKTPKIDPRRISRDPIGTIDSMLPSYKRYVSAYDDEDDFI